MLNRINFGSLFWKLTIPVVVIFSVAIIGLGVFIPGQIEKNIVGGTTYSAKQTAKQYKILRKYYVNNVLKKVKAGSKMRPAIKHKNNPNAFPLPATMIHDLSKLLKNEGTRVTLYSAYPFPNRKSRALDEFQTKAWAFLSRNPKKSYVHKYERNGKTIVRVAVADIMVAQTCVSCHNSHPNTPKVGWNIGDVRGVLEISSDISPQLSAGAATNIKIMLALVVALLLIVMAIYYVFRVVIARRLEAVGNTMHDLTSSNSDLTRRLDTSGSDEISRIAKGFNSFVSSYQNFALEVNGATQTLVESSEEMALTTTESKKNSAEQKLQISQIATAITQMAATVQEVAANTATADESAQSARLETIEGQRVVEDNIQVTKKLSNEIENVALVIQNLKSDSQGIGAVLDVIRGISEQTNLLALNAAIEAARAGEHGRGFAVVADEVRTLASKTQVSTVEIQDMIERLQQGADNAVSVMDRSIEAVAVSVDQAAQAGQNLNSITDTVNSISAINSQIATAIEEQNAVAEDISKNIVEVDILAQQNDESSSRIATANGNIVDLTENLSSIVRRLKVK